MRYLELAVTDFADDTDPTRHTEWIHRDHIETIEPYTTGTAHRPMVWLELTLTSGRIRYIPLRSTLLRHIDDTARTAISALLEHGDPVNAAAVPDGVPPAVCDAAKSS